MLILKLTFIDRPEIFNIYTDDTAGIDIIINKLCDSNPAFILLLFIELIIIVLIWIFYCFLTKEKIKIFIGYTMKKGGLEKKTLQRIKYELRSYNTYIDIIDSPKSPNWQEIVYKNIRNSSIILFIDTGNLLESKWVKKEIMLATTYQKTIIYLKFDLNFYIPQYANKLISSLVKK